MAAEDGYSVTLRVFRPRIDSDCLLIAVDMVGDSIWSAWDLVCGGGETVFGLLGSGGGEMHREGGIGGL